LGRRAFAPGIGWLIIEAVELIELKSLTDDDAASDGFATRAAMIKALQVLYPENRHDGRHWYRVRFRVDELIQS
jgi:hypothetical protein